MSLRGKVIRSRPEPQLDDDSYEADYETPVEVLASSEAATATAGSTEEAPADEFAAVLSEAQDIDETKAEETPAEQASEGSDASPTEKDSEEDKELSDDEKLIAEYCRQTKQTHEQGVEWLRQRKAEAASRQQPANMDGAGEAQNNEQKRAPQMTAGRASLLGGLGGMLGSSLRETVGGTIRAGRAARDAAARRTGINRAAGMTPEMVRNRMFSQWHNQYETGVRKIDNSMDALAKAAAAYNQVIRTSAPGRELEKIANSRGQDLQTLLSEITAGTVDDSLAKDHMEALRTNPQIQKAWAGVDRHNRALEDGVGMMKTGMRQIGENFPERVDMNIEAARVSEILERRTEVEKPFQIPANPIGDQKANGKSPQKSMWEQFQEVTQGGLSFLRDLVDRFSNFVAAKFGAR